VLPLKTKVQPADDQAVALKAITDAAEEGLEALSGVWKQKWMAPHREALQIDLERLKLVAAAKVLDISTLMGEREKDIAAMLPEDGVRVEVAADKRKAAIREQQAKAKAKEGAE
jgi:hypothetical protein